MEIEKLCEEFHQKVGKDKNIRIIIEEGNVEDFTGWVTGKINGYKLPKTKGDIKSLPFNKVSKGNGIQYHYERDKFIQGE